MYFSSLTERGKSAFNNVKTRKTPKTASNHGHIQLFSYESDIWPNRNSKIEDYKPKDSIFDTLNHYFNDYD